MKRTSANTATSIHSGWSTRAEAGDAADERAFAKKNKKKKDNPSTGTTKGYLELMDDDYIKSLGFDPHKIKRRELGKKADISLFDLYRDKDTGELFSFRKKGKGLGIATGEFIRK